MPGCCSGVGARGNIVPRIVHSRGWIHRWKGSLVRRTSPRSHCTCGVWQTKRGGVSSWQAGARTQRAGRYTRRNSHTKSNSANSRACARTGGGGGQGCSSSTPQTPRPQSTRAADVHRCLAREVALLRRHRLPSRAHTDIRVLRPGPARAVDEVLDGVGEGGAVLGERLAVDLERARGAWGKK